MYIIPPLLIKLLHICEFITLFIGVLKFKKIKATYWKWFVFYLIYIFIYWLYAYKSLKNKRLFWIFTFLFLSSLFGEEILNNSNFTFKSFNNTIGTFLLLILVILEFIRQIKSDRIIHFYSDKMFYINIGVILFYIGNMPFFGLYQIILKYPSIWNNYYIYFMISNSIMYLLFAASFIWGKPK